MFAAKYHCPSDQITVRSGDDFEVSGCGTKARYICWEVPQVDHPHSVGPNECRQLKRIQYQATDGSLHESMEGDNTAQREAAIASAAHDLPCAPASVVADGELGLGGTTLEGCGQRVTYKVVDDSGVGVSYVLIGRVAIPAP
jgi:hypothetical protein